MGHKSLPEAEFLRVKAVAALLGIGESTVWLWTKDGRLPKPIRLGNKCTLWNRKGIEQYLSGIGSTAAASADPLAA